VGIGQLLGHGVGTFGNEMLRAGLHGVNSGLISSLDGGNFFTGMATGSVSSLVGSGTQALGMSNTLVRASTAVAGSVSSGLLGGGWIEGAMQGYDIGTFNHTWKYLGNGLYECTLDEIVVTASRRSFMGAVHAGLDAAGLILDAADGLNGMLYLAEGDYINAGLSAAAMVPVIGSFATSGKYAMKASDIMTKMGTKYTKSSLENGKKMHKIYKSAEEIERVRIKEFRISKGSRADFVDFKTHSIYELKPFNPRSVKSGIKQLDRYGRAMNSKFGGKWNLFLDLY
jgi:hypothetical protein